MASATATTAAVPPVSDHHRQQSGGHHQPFAVSLPSPTLTNPDMILPDAYHSPSRSPSPPPSMQRPPSPSHLLRRFHSQPQLSSSFDDAQYHGQPRDEEEGDEDGRAHSYQHQPQQYRHQHQNQHHWRGRSSISPPSPFSTIREESELGSDPDDSDPEDGPLGSGRASAPGSAADSTPRGASRYRGGFAASKHDYYAPANNSSSALASSPTLRPDDEGDDDDGGDDGVGGQRHPPPAWARAQSVGSSYSNGGRSTVMAMATATVTPTMATMERRLSGGSAGSMASSVRSDEFEQHVRAWSPRFQNAGVAAKSWARGHSAGAGGGVGGRFESAGFGGVVGEGAVGGGGEGAEPVVVEDEEGKGNVRGEQGTEREGEASGDDSEGWQPSQEEEDGDDDASSSAALSRRAEIILANAKKRLNLMEGNLRGARHSLLVTPSSSLSSLKAATELSAQLAAARERDRQMYPGLGFLASRQRQLHSSPLASGSTPPGGGSTSATAGAAASPGSSGSSPGHARVFSETSLPPLPLASPVPMSSSAQLLRSSSALGGSLGPPPGAVPAGAPAAGLRSPLGPPAWRSHTSFDDYRALRQPTPELRAARSPVPVLGPLPEDEAAAAEAAAAAAEYARDDGSVSEMGGSANGEGTEGSVTTGGYRGAGSGGGELRRSASTTSDLRAQVSQLKGRISSLQQRAREDGLRRRSLQSLRTPSPFTAAEIWYGGADAYKGHQPAVAADAGLGWKMAGGSGSGGGHVHAGDLQQQGGGGRHHRASSMEYEGGGGGEVGGLTEYTESSYEDAEDGFNTEDMSAYDDDEFESVLEEAQYEDQGEVGGEEGFQDGMDGESVYEEANYYDEDNVPVAERHEDRADAFDYEHFFLHSAMGSYSGAGGAGGAAARGRRGSASSEGSTASVETTRAVSPMMRGGSGDHSTGDDDAAAAATPTNTKAFSGAVAAALAQSQATPRASLHHRNDSVDSVSTMATFATAAEGQDGSDDDEGEACAGPDTDCADDDADAAAAGGTPRARRSVAAIDSALANQAHAAGLSAHWPMPATAPLPAPLPQHHQLPLQHQHQRLHYRAERKVDSGVNFAPASAPSSPRDMLLPAAPPSSASTTPRSSLMQPPHGGAGGGKPNGAFVFPPAWPPRRRPRPASIVLSALLASSVYEADSPGGAQQQGGGAVAKPMTLGERDRERVYGLVGRLQQLCVRLQGVGEGMEAGEEGEEIRRRLDEAARVLGGGIAGGGGGRSPEMGMGNGVNGGGGLWG
ncbi:hypothetical protein BDY21DRAFT_418735 [Lineolata rhizophorae]|uniref:Uncharacterized protein n=1 Tax=Lineolata rhizophorae TaxID=578093 RepID=A0A6A6P9T8_9PEZI|nr:hypothetical protein BDY21DRAFT_418735 [Lineolata rhizophorae]